MDVNIRDLRYFLAVAEELNFTRAATTRLFISQPTLSKQIGQLESQLRTKLFERDRRGVSLTAAGELLVPAAQRIVADWEQVQRSLAAADDRRSRTLVIGFQTRIGRGLIPAVTAETERSAPGWRLTFRQVAWSDPTAGLADGLVDVAVAWLPLAGAERLRHRVVAEEDRWVALPPGHRLAARAVVPFAELADEPMIALPASAGALRAFWLGDDARDRPAHVAAEAETAEETFEAVASGLGAVLLSEGNARIYARDDVEFRPVSGLAPSRLAVVWRAGDEREIIRLFASACTRCLERGC